MRSPSILAIILAFLFVSACSDGLVGSRDAAQTDAEPSATSTVAPVSEQHPKLRHPQLMDLAHSGVAGKLGDKVNLYLAFNEYEADGVTRRVLDSYGITRRVLEEYGVTRRVLDSYGITRRVLDEYGVTRRVLDEYGVTRRVLDSYGISKRVLDAYSEITDALLAQYNVTLAQLESQGVTRRVLDSYKITRRVLDDYNVSAEALDTALASFDNVLRLRLRVSKTRPGISLSFGVEYLDAILEELYTDPDIDMIDPDFAMDQAVFDVRRGFKESNEMIPWSVQRIGGVFTRFNNERVHVYSLDSGVLGEDLDLVEKKDFTMLFQNRDVEFMDEEAIIHMDVFDPGDQGDYRDGSGHGSHVAGIIGAKQNDKGVRGVARGVKFHSLKVLTDEGRTDLTTVMAAVDYVTDQKQRNPLRPMVLNMSLGMDLGNGGYNALDDAVAKAASNGVVVVVSAGNDGRDAATYSPAHVREVITVGAYDRNDQFAPYSNYGSVVDLLAPGSDIVSLTHIESEYSANENVLMSGTSHAAPHVAGAAALYLALNPEASPAAVKQALINSARTGIQGVPMGTTDRTVFVGGFAADGNEKSFAIDEAEWKDGQRLVLQGTGERLAEIAVYSLADLSEITTTQVNASGYWKVDMTLTGSVPCEVEARFGTTRLEMDVRNAPSTCAKEFELDRARWRRGEIEVKGSGPAGATIELYDHERETLLPMGSFVLDATGDFQHKVDLSPAPCTVRATLGGGNSLTISVEGAEGCATSGSTADLMIEKAEFGINEYGVPQFKVRGMTAPFAEVTFFNAVNGASLGSIVAEDDGEFYPKWKDPLSVPCEVRVDVASIGASATAVVEDAPTDCVGGFRLADATWKSDTNELRILVVGTPYADVTLKNGRNAAPFFNGRLNALGRFDKNLRNLAVVPCSVIATSDTDSQSREVANKPGDCDVDLVVNTTQWTDVQWMLSMGGTGTLGMPLKLYNRDNGSEMTSTTVDTFGNWRIDLDLSEVPVPPCFVEARGANGDVVTKEIATNCNPDFVYHAPGSTWEQNPYSFVEITKAEWRASDRLLKLEGGGYVFMKALLTSTHIGAEIAVVVTDRNEEWSAYITNPDVIPCSLTATLDGRVATKVVTNAPPNCDNKDYLLIERLEWDAGKSKLKVEGEAMTADGSSNPPVVLTHGASGNPIGVVNAASDASFRFESSLDRAPCSVTVMVGGISRTVDTKNAVAGSCAM